MISHEELPAEILRARAELESQRINIKTDPYMLAASMMSLAIKLKASNERVESEAFFKEALAVRRKHFPADIRVAASASYLGRLLEETDQREEAEPLYREALEIFRKLLPAGHPNISVSLRNLASVLDELKGENRLTEAESLMREALDLSRKSTPGNPPELAGCLSDLGAHLSDRLLLDEAEDFLGEAVRIYRQHSLDGDLSYALARFARLRLAQSRPGEAEALAREALILREKEHPPTDHRVAKAKSLLGLCLTRLNRLEEAYQLLGTALYVLENTPCALGAGPSRIEDTRNRLSELRTRQGDPAIWSS